MKEPIKYVDYLESLVEEMSDFLFEETPEELKERVNEIINEVKG